jgi:hypothetical protein
MASGFTVADCGDVLDLSSCEPCAVVTVSHAMMEHAKLVAGQTVLLQDTAFRCSARTAAT